MAKLPAWWTDPYPEVISAKTATDYLDALGAKLKREKQHGKWTLSTGDQELVQVDQPAELDSFILGFALAHLICERHGLIGARPGPTAASAAAAAPAEGDG
jgi:hypothetical protein